MPLSEEELRILREIEQGFYATDPEFADQVGRTTIYRHGLRRLKLAALLFVVGLGVLVAMLVAGNAVLAFVLGAIPMFAAALLFEANLRMMGRNGIQDLTKSMKASALRDALGNARSRARERFKRDE